MSPVLPTLTTGRDSRQAFTYRNPPKQAQFWRFDRVDQKGSVDQVHLRPKQPTLLRVNHPTDPTYYYEAESPSSHRHKKTKVAGELRVETPIASPVYVERYDRIRLVAEFDEERRRFVRERQEMEGKINQLLLEKKALQKKLLTQKRMIRWLEGERQRAKKQLLETILVDRTVQARIEERRQETRRNRRAGIYWQEHEFKRLEGDKHEYSEVEREKEERKQGSTPPIPQQPQEVPFSKDIGEPPDLEESPTSNDKLRLRLQRPISAVSSSQTIGGLSASGSLFSYESSVAASIYPMPRMSVSPHIPWVGFN
ncbi:hypothetical protein FA15DRAFT_756971 [Coprinopsis marcescibilis]|uniref:Uncharacterized protein n=1 Tax=Coprinopsis marcescibilis TaxID=230819 RepID=A0A5C3KTA1_COPMA|nr:hypothetical protein FA15DRAFT_756971 [Coprinopsis marcescibilis]